MRSRSFLDLAKRLVIIPHEANWRTAANRAYYALMLECREALAAWGFNPPKSDSVHRFVRLRFVGSAIREIDSIGAALDYLGPLRSIADYRMVDKRFVSDADAQKALARTETALIVLDQIVADPVRRAAAIADIKSRWP